MTPTSPASPHDSLACHTLLLPQQIAIWLIRRGVDAGIDATTDTATRVFGATLLDQGRRALGQLIELLHRSPLDTPPVHPLGERTMSREEFDLLTALGLMQQGQGGAARDAIDRWGWPAAGDAGHVERALRGLGVALRRAGRALPCAHARPMLTTAGVRTTCRLDPRENLLVHGVRLWVRWARDGDDAGASLAASLQAQGFGAAARSLHAILTTTVAAAARRVVVHQPGCGPLSCDEARVLHAVSSMQRSRDGDAFELMLDWLQPAAVRVTLPVLRDLAAALSDAGHRLPLRDWHFPELTGHSTWSSSPYLTHGARLH